MSIVCIIPARAGSQRIPGKNYKDFLGKPIILYPFERALRSNVFQDIFVYTDSDEIKKIISKQYILDRDNVSDDQTLSQMLDEALKKINRKYDYICVLLPTAVFFEENNLRISYKKLLSYNHIDSICSVSRDYDIPVDWKRDKDYKLLFSVYHRDAGQYYFIKKESFDKDKSLIGKNCYIVECNAIDINTMDDWKAAEVKILNGRIK